MQNISSYTRLTDNCSKSSQCALRLPLRSSGSWLQIQRSWCNSRCYQIFQEVVGQEWRPLSLVSTIEELLGRKSSGSCLEIQEYGHGDPFSWPCDTLYPQKLALPSPKSSGRSVGIVCPRTRAKQLFFSVFKGINAHGDVFSVIKTPVLFPHFFFNFQKVPLWTSNMYVKLSL
jgi:hypothetical protein